MGSLEWQTNIVNSFEQFVDEIYKLMPAATALNERCWFRGQTNARWDLVSSYMRSSCKLGLPDEALTDLESASRMAFRSQAHLFVSPSLLEKVKTIPCWWRLCSTMVLPRGCSIGRFPLMSRPILLYSRMAHENQEPCGVSVVMSYVARARETQSAGPSPTSIHPMLQNGTRRNSRPSTGEKS